METWVLGIDPGKSGGIALLNPKGMPIVAPTAPTPFDFNKQVMEFKTFAEGQGGKLHAWVEAVHSMPRDGVKSAFTFGKWVGYLEMVLIVNGIPFDSVKPQEWMTFLNCMTKGDKNVTKSKAQMLYPEWADKITLRTADALLIAHYGRGRTA